MTRDELLCLLDENIKQRKLLLQKLEKAREENKSISNDDISAMFILQAEFDELKRKVIDIDFKLA